MAAAGLLAVPLIAPFGVHSVGTWLVVEDPLQPANAIVVLGGQLPFRAMEAATLYKQGWTKEIWLTKGALSEEDRALDSLGIGSSPESSGSRKVLERLGVPSTSIHVLDAPTADTADEVRVAARELQSHGGRRLIFVTSKFHTRRVKALWHALVGSGLDAVVRYTSFDPAVPERWWRNTDDVLAVTREWLGLLNTWAGLPVKPRR